MRALFLVVLIWRPGGCAVIPPFQNVPARHRDAHARPGFLRAVSPRGRYLHHDVALPGEIRRLGLIDQGARTIIKSGR